jgi:hypothetical protein
MIAWVFWIHGQKNFEVPGTWKVHGAWETKKECEVTKKSWFDNSAKPFLAPAKVTILIPNEKYAIEYPNGAVLAEAFYCLPDTVDPRK